MLRLETRIHSMAIALQSLLKQNQELQFLEEQQIHRSRFRGMEFFMLGKEMVIRKKGIIYFSRKEQKYLTYLEIMWNLLLHQKITKQESLHWILQEIIFQSRARDCMLRAEFLLMEK